MSTSASTFSPDAICTRAQVMTFLWNAMGRPVQQASRSPFTDVAETDYFYQPVLWAVGQGITSGTSATTFSPNQTCTQAHVLTFLWHTMGDPAPQLFGGSSDYYHSKAWYDEPVDWARERGLLTHYLYVSPSLVTKLLIPDDSCSRAQAVYYLYTALTQEPPMVWTFG